MSPKARTKNRNEKMNYEIRYHHTSAQSAATRAEAMIHIETQAIRAHGNSSAFADHVIVRADGDQYVYLSQEDADADAEGTAAFALITRPDQSEE